MPVDPAYSVVVTLSNGERLVLWNTDASEIAVRVAADLRRYGSESTIRVEGPEAFAERRTA